MTETPLIENLTQTVDSQTAKIKAQAELLDKLIRTNDSQTATIKAQGEQLDKLIQTLEGMQKKTDTLVERSRPTVQAKQKKSSGSIFKKLQRP